MDVFLQVRIEHMFQQTGETVIVFGNNQNKGVGLCNGGGKSAVLNGLSGIIDRKPDISDVDEIRSDVASFRHAIENEMRGVFAGPTLPGSPQDYRSKDRTSEILSIHDQFVARDCKNLQSERERQGVSDCRSCRARPNLLALASIDTCG